MAEPAWSLAEREQMMGLLVRLAHRLQFDANLTDEQRWQKLVESSEYLSAKDRVGEMLSEK